MIGGNWSRDSASWFGWVIGAGDVPVFSSALVNGTGGANELLLGAYGGTAFSSARINSISATFSATDTNGKGLYLATRTGATAVRYDKHGVNLATNATASTAPVNTGFRCSYSHDRPLAAFGIGGGVDATQSAALYSALNVYLTAIGAV